MTRYTFPSALFGVAYAVIQPAQLAQVCKGRQNVRIIKIDDETTGVSHDLERSLPQSGSPKGDLHGPSRIARNTTSRSASASVQHWGTSANNHEARPSAGRCARARQPGFFCESIDNIVLTALTCDRELVFARTARTWYRTVLGETPLVFA